MYECFENNRVVFHIIRPRQQLRITLRDQHECRGPHRRAAAGYVKHAIPGGTDSYNLKCSQRAQLRL